MEQDHYLQDYPTRAYSTKPSFFQSSSYDPLPPQQDFSIPRRPVQTSRNESEASLINGGDKPYGPGPSTSRYRFLPTWLRWWFPEILATTFAVISLLSIVIVLRVYNGRELDQLNLPAGLTLNGIIAAVATIQRTCLMVPVGSALSQEAWLWFSSDHQSQTRSRSRLIDLELSDNASRGAWGSIVFLFFARGRWLAIMGALISIVSLAIGTFTQQLLATKSIPVTNPTSSLLPGNIPRAETFTNWTGNPAEGGNAWGPLLNMKAAVYNGLMTEGLEPLTATCLTGNCTWPLTTSLAVCGGCQNSTYKVSCGGYTTSEGHTYGPEYCNYTMPSGNIANITAVGDNDEGYGFQVMASPGAHYNATKYDRWYVSNFDMIGAPYGTYGANFNNSTIVSAECALWMCIHTYNVSTRSTGQTQSVVSTFADANASVLSRGFSGGQLALFDPLPSDMPAVAGQNFTVEIFAVEALESYMSGLVNGTVFLNLESQSFSNDAVEALWNGTQNLNAWISNVALSMSNIVRSSALQERAAYNGTAYTLGLQVKWEWMILPILMTLLAFLLLIIVMVRTTKSPVEAWKGSPLAFLLFDVDQEMRHSIRGQTQRYKGIEDSIGEKKAVLTRQPSGVWAFKAVAE